MVVHNNKLFFISIFISSLLACFSPQPANSDDNLSIPSFAFSWENEKGTFMAGDVATIKIKVLGSFESEKYNYTFSPNITINEKVGNSSFISGVNSHFGEDINNWSISFIPIMVGLFNVLITDTQFHVLDSSLHFQVTPGKMYPTAGIVSWLDGTNEFIAGTKATVLILPKDAFGNNISYGNEDAKAYSFSISAVCENGSVASVLDIIYNGWNKIGYLSIELTVATSGDLLLDVQEQNQTLRGSPLPFKVFPGAVDVPNCIVQWNVTTIYFQLFSVMEAYILQRDQYGNLVPGMYAFEVEILENQTNLSVPIPDLSFKESGPGIQVFSFKLEESGDFKLMIFSKDHKKYISNVPFHFTVYIGYCDGVNSIVNGSGLNHSFAGEDAILSVFLRDAYLYPSPVELEKLQVRVLHESGSVQIDPNIYPYISANGTSSVGSFNHGVLDSTKRSLVNIGFKASNFEVIFMPQKSGLYEISIFCGNILLNNGQPFRKEVSPGKVNISLSGVLKYASKAQKMMKSELLVNLMDSYSNPIPSHQSKLKLEIASHNVSNFSTSPFIDNKNGSYTVTYTLEDVGTYEICASYDGERFTPCPFSVNVYRSEYFPRAYGDTVSVWEDESRAFDVLLNDYYAGGNASISDFSKVSSLLDSFDFLYVLVKNPRITYLRQINHAVIDITIKPDHGSLLQYGHLFRYTPYKGFFGNDSFMYTLLDVNGNLASGIVNIPVLILPPQFVSFPKQLHGTEDLISPRFGGFTGLEIIYSDLTEKITVFLSAQSGTVSLSCMQMHFWNPIWSDLSVEIDVDNKQLTLVSALELMNFALQGIQYFGKENFSGDDMIRVTTMNRNGRNNLEIPIFVDPINDPPFIKVPETIEIEDSKEEVLLFDKKKDKFDFFTGDPDLISFPGNKSHFLVIFSLEVSSGQLKTSLPSELINTTELKLKTNYRWQPLQTFVSISRHFTVNAKAIRFQGTIDDCNSIMEQLYFHGGKFGAVLTVSINDMGNYGCYPNCDELMTKPLFAEASINLVRKRPTTSVVSYFLGSAIMVEFVVVLYLGMLLLYFICKCVFALINEKRSRPNAKDIELSKLQNSQEQAASSSRLSGKRNHLAECSSSILNDNEQISWHSGYVAEEEEFQIQDMKNSNQYSNDQLQLNSRPGFSS